jgi:hypothetical protein
MRMSKQNRNPGAPTSSSALSAKRERPSAETHRRFAIVIVAAVSLAAIWTPFRSGSAQPAAQAQATTAASRNAALVTATAEVLKETSEIRQLPVLRQVQSSTQSRAEIERMLIKNLDEETTPAQLHASEVTLKKLGLAPPDFKYRELMLRLLTEQVAGYYDPKMREFHLADWIDLDGQKPVMAHELTHALQDQHFDLRRFTHWPKGDSDAELAAHALIEGDATLAMSFYVLRDPLRALAFLKSMGASGMASDELDKAPRALRESLLFPYQNGLIWTRRLYGEGGWARVSKAFTELPQSTEQILHPDKYFAREAPVNVTLPDLTPLLNRKGQKADTRGQSSEIRRSADISVSLSAQREPSLGAAAWAGTTQPGAGSADVPSALSAQREQIWTAATRRRFSSSLNHAQPARAAWKRIDADVNGEFGLYLILDQFLKSPAESRRATAGWGGDRSAVYEGPKGEVLVVSLSTWDTENDAREFFDAYVKRTGLRYPGATLAGAAANPKAPTLSGTFRTSEGDVTIELRGARVLILEGAPGNMNTRAITAALSQ